MLAKIVAIDVLGWTDPGDGWCLGGLILLLSIYTGLLIKYRRYGKVDERRSIGGSESAFGD